VSRYKIRNEESRVTFMDERFEAIKMKVFGMMKQATQDSFPWTMNPFITRLEDGIARFKRDLSYYDFGDPGEFNDAYLDLKRNITNVESITRFIRLIVSKLIPDTYQINRYVRDQ
jgi:hypothetical protein